MSVVITVPLHINQGATPSPWVTTPDGVLWRQSAAGTAQINCVLPVLSVAWGNAGGTVTNPANPFVTGAFYGDTTADYVATLTYPDGGAPPGFIVPPPPPTSGCVRRAWLTLGASSIELHDEAAGYFCTSLVVGYPEVRAVVSNRPDQHGIDDRTRYFGSRVVTAEVVTFSGSAASIDDVADSFGPFMVPNVRPTLHWILDRPGTPERTLVVRAADYAWAIEGDDERRIHLGWIAADPVARATVVSTASAWSGASVGAGRAYSLTFARTYPVGTSGPTTGVIRPTGDVPIRPLYRLFGPITYPRLHFPGMRGDGTAYTFDINFVMSLTVGASQWIDVDSANRTALLMGDPTQSVQSSIDWNTTTWGAIDPAPGYSYMQLTGSSTSDATQVAASWTEGFLT